MTYGLRVYKLGSTTKTLLDTDEDSRSMVIQSQGTVSANGSLDYKPGDVVMVRPADSNFSGKWIAVAAEFSISGSGQSATFTASFQTYGFGTAGGNLSYVILRENNQLPAATGQEYGLRCQTSNTIVEFDSRNFSATNEFQITELYTFGRGHGSTLLDSATDNTYLSITGMFRSTVSNFARDRGYIWEDVSSGTLIFAGGLNNFGLTHGQIYGSGTANGTVRQFVERTSVGNVKYYNDFTDQGYFEGQFRT